MAIKLLHDLVAVRADQKPEISPGGIILSESAKEHSLTGTVIDVGPGKLSREGRRIPIDLRPGDRVRYVETVRGQYFNDEGEEILFINVDDIVGRI